VFYEILIICCFGITNDNNDSYLTDKDSTRVAEEVKMSTA